MPEAPRIIVCNTTPLIALFLLQRLELLREPYGSVVVPPAVYQEFLAGLPQIIRAEALEKAPWIQIVNLRTPRNVDFLADLDQEGAEAIALVQEMSVDLIILDEKLGSKYAHRLGLDLDGLSRGGPSD